MQVSMERLLQGVIDYAGLFPPARLSMSDAVDRYLSILSGPESWLVSRFVCPTARLDELRQALEARPGHPYLPVAAVGRASSTQADWSASIAQDAEDMNRFNKEMGERGEIEGYEVAVPDLDRFPDYLRDLGGFRDAEVFVELPWAVGMDDALAALAESEWIGAKARTGGLSSAAFPDAWQLAGFLHGCMSLDVSFKLTAGLHHPLPHKDAAIGATMHGFLNVLGAAAFAISEDLSRRDMERLLLDDNPKAWNFNRNELSWNSWRANRQDLDEARDRFVSFGSCSVDEPLQDLQELGFRPS